MGSFYPAIVGGTSLSMYWLARAMKKNGYDVVIPTTHRALDADIPRDRWLERDFGRVIYCSDRSHYWSPGMIARMKEELPDADIVMLSSFFLPAQLWAARLAINMNKPILWSVRGSLNNDAMVYRTALKKLSLGIVRSWRRNIVFHTTTGAESDVTRKWIGSDSRIIEIPNYLQLEPCLMPQNPGKVLLYCGRVHPRKLIERLIKACNISAEFERSGYRLRIVGDTGGSYSIKLKELVQERGMTGSVEFVDFIADTARKHQIYRDSRFSFLISDAENFGNSVVESLMQGTPAVASLGTPWKLLDEYRAGFWIENDVESVSRIIDSIIAMDDLTYEQYRQNARRLVEERFDINHNFHKWDDALLTISGRSRV